MGGGGRGLRTKPWEMLEVTEKGWKLWEVSLMN